MALLPQAVADQVALDGLPRVAIADDSSQHVLYLDGTFVRSMSVADWLIQRGPLPADPTPEQIAAAIAARETATLQAAADAAALRQQILQAAQSTVGVVIDQLTAQQRNALVALLLYKAGAIDKDLKIKPLTEWVK